MILGCLSQNLVTTHSNVGRYSECFWFIKIQRILPWGAGTVAMVMWGFDSNTGSFVSLYFQQIFRLLRDYCYLTFLSLKVYILKSVGIVRYSPPVIGQNTNTTNTTLRPLRL